MTDSRVARTGFVLGIATFAGVVAYAVYFDHKRRNDPSFRKKLRKEKKKVDKTRAEDGSSSAVNTAVLRQALDEIRNEPTPELTDEKEQYFMSQVAMGEQLSIRGPEFQLPAAMSFYRALRVYPSPVELIMIYQKTVPDPIFKLVMEMTNLDLADKIEDYYNQFPPSSMNVIVDQREHGLSIKGAPAKKKVLTATKDFSEGEIIYTEDPLVASLALGLKSHCSFCFKKIDASSSVPGADDMLKAEYCSKQCLDRAETGFHKLLFGAEPPFPEAEAAYTSDVKAARRKAQQAFAAYLEENSTILPLLVARFIGMQIAVETAKMQKKDEASGPFVPECVPQSGYSISDHIARLRYVPTIPPDEESVLLREVLGAAVPGLEAFITEERYATLKSQIAYNIIGVTFQQSSSPSVHRSLDKARNPYGTTSEPVGAGLYCVSSYISHSCNPSTRPTFPSGTSKLHLVATRPITVGEELSMAWVDTAQQQGVSRDASLSHRRSELDEAWHFSCLCDKCAQEMDPADKFFVKDESRLTDEIQRAEGRPEVAV